MLNVCPQGRKIANATPYFPAFSRPWFPSLGTENNTIPNLFHLVVACAGFCVSYTACKRWDRVCTAIIIFSITIQSIYSVSQKNPPLRGPDISRFSHKRLRIFNRFFTHLLHVPICARLQIFIQLSPILTKFCHIKRDYPVHIICSKCPPSVETHALTRLRKSLIALLIVVCGK